MKLLFFILAAQFVIDGDDTYWSTQSHSHLLSSIVAIPLINQMKIKI